MTQHYPHNVIEDSAWCKTCYAMTPHHVSGGQLGYCKVCFAKRQDAAQKPAEPPPQQSFLFEPAPATGRAF